MAYKMIQVKTEGRVGVITFDRAAALNALCDELTTELLQKLAEVPLLHMRAIRAQTIGEQDRARQSIGQITTSGLRSTRREVRAGPKSVLERLSRSIPEPMGFKRS